MLNSSVAVSRASTDRSAEAFALRQHNSLTRGRCIGSALFNPFSSIRGRRQSPSHGLTTPVDRLMRRHALTLCPTSARGLTPSSSVVTGLCVLARTI